MYKEKAGNKSKESEDKKYDISIDTCKIFIKEIIGFWRVGQDGPLMVGR